MLVFWLLLLFPFISTAQVLFDTPSENWVVHIEPRAPKPGQEVRLSVTPSQSASLVRWYANEKLLHEGIGVFEATTTAPLEGAETAIYVTDGVRSGEASLRTFSVDILWSAESHTPLWYRGASLPTEHSPLRLEALTLQEYPKNALFFEWRVNGTVQKRLSGSGKSFARVTPPLGGIRDVSVIVRSDKGEILGEEEVRIPLLKVRPLLYQENNLFGVKYTKALGQQTFVSDTDSIFQLIPFYSFQAPEKLTYEWSINGERALVSPEEPHRIRITSDTETAVELTSQVTDAAGLIHLTSSWLITLASRIPTL